MSPTFVRDYTLTGVNAAAAVEKGLAEADWYTSPIPKERIRVLLQRRDGPALCDTALLAALLLASGFGTVALWGSWWAVVPYLVYSVLYGTSSDSRWHECGHGTAFKTDWMNIVVYEVASFMVMRESVVWRWSHNRHHSDTIIIGRDPEIQIPRPPNLRMLFLSLFGLPGYRAYFPSLIRHALGRIADAERTFIPESEYPRVYRTARICLFIYGLVLASAIVLHSWIPIFLFLLPQFFGTWLMIVHNTTQHAGLAENVLDHRLNCRTVYMNAISRFIYWNMNYHLEHHMFPLVPYHALPALHAAVRQDCPPPYPSILSAWREIFPTVLRQVKDPGYHIKRQLPQPAGRVDKTILTTTAKADRDGWIEVCDEALLERQDILRFDYGRKTYALYRDAAGKLFATDGICTHGNTHLVDGLIKDDQIECPKHNGRFKLADGSPARAPVCRGLATYPIETRHAKLFLNVQRAGGAGARAQKPLTLRLLSTRNVATFIRELVFEPLEPLAFSPGDYLQFDIPAYEVIRFSDFDVPQPYRAVWEAQHVFDLVGRNPTPGRRNNYSIAGAPQAESSLRFNVRIATPPPGQDCAPGVGSAYMFSLKPGATVTAIGPFGDFHIKPTQKEMIYIGGGSGMAPLRAHIAHLFHVQKTGRRVSFWYGARSRQEIFYADYFEAIAAKASNFRFHLALSAPLPEDNWTGHRGLIHQAAAEEYLQSHPGLGAVEFYLCGPPQMIAACLKMLGQLGVADSQIAYDEF
jgi:Na+-transporting NADH:ubiquinone oxidoreductase subunit F